MNAPALSLRHAGGVCPIHIGPGLLDSLPALLARYLAGRPVVVIADDRVAQAVPVPLELPTLTFPAGEASKTRATWASLTDRLLDLGLGRDGAIVALGGGVTGDLAGFVAATYLRGIPFLQVPTSLLAMLDASIGGKTGVDVPAGKNLVGAFHQPVAVVMDPRALRTLPDPELRYGLAEAVKHALIADAAHFEWLREHLSRIQARDDETLATLLRRSVGIKVAVVAADEREAGPRAMLNAGHTVAHALEQVTGYAVPHGEAVAIGLVIEARLGESLGHSEWGTSERLAGLLRACGLPTELPGGIDRVELVEAMQADKKNRGGEVHFSFARGIGHAEAPWTRPASLQAIRSVL